MMFAVVRLLARLVPVLFAPLIFLEAATAETMHEALAKAYATSPDLREARAALRVLDEGVPQALAGWRPTLSVSGSGGVERSDSSVSTTQSLTPLSGQFDISQPLYSGGATVAGTQQAENLVLASRADLIETEQQVLLDGVTAYMDVLRDLARVQLNANNEQVLRRQLEATTDRFEVGEVTRTDVAQAEARLARTVAERLEAEGQLAVSSATYERVVGTQPQSLTAAPPLPSMPASLRDGLGIGLEENPRIVSASFAERAANDAVRVAFAEVLPTVDLAGQVVRSRETSLENVSSESESLLARVTIPIYQAGLVHAQVREAKEFRNQRRIQVERVRREVVELITQAWELLETARSNVKARLEEVRANEIALEGVRQEAAVGSRTTLDVLDAEQELLDARVALVVAERNEYVAGFTLLSAIGRLTAAGLGVPVDAYDPTVHYNRVRDRYWGWDEAQ
ncbi:MAG: TolC family outer membrane protein [Alphaproteobacteria bacterium]|jgi:TolC family type I secretion outer membrane protein|nr:TolC family outer membrane protein [Alphaproteobacteria bacterium]